MHCIARQSMLMRYCANMLNFLCIACEIDCKFLIWTLIQTDLHTHTHTNCNNFAAESSRARQTDGRTVVFEIERVASGARCRLGSLAIGFSELRLDARVRIGDFGAPL